MIAISHSADRHRQPEFISESVINGLADVNVLCARTHTIYLDESEKNY